jgi:hypothetical protein
MKAADVAAFALACQGLWRGNRVAAAVAVRAGAVPDAMTGRPHRNDHSDDDAVPHASLRHNPRRADHIKYTRSEAEQEKYSESPRRNPERAVDEPTETGSD